MPTDHGLKNHSSAYAFAGFTFGIFAPVAWTMIRLVLFPEPGLSIIDQVFSDFTKSTYHIALYIYMGFGTACVMALLGYFIGRGTDELNERAQELDVLHREVAEQKEMFENRYKVLDNNIKNFHHISNRIQKSIDRDEVLNLCAEGLHDVLGYERVNILIADDARKNLLFAASTGSENANVGGVKIPLDGRSGVIYKCFSEKRLYFIDDIGKYSEDYHLQPPVDTVKALRSRSFVLCPIIVKGESVGVFGIDNKFTLRSMNDTDVDTVKLFADQAASAITKINLLNAINALTTELEDSFSTLLKDRENYARNVYNLRVAVETVADGTARIVSASDSVLFSVDETSSAVSQISVSIDQVTQNLDFLAESIDRAVTAMEEMGESIKNVEKNAVISHEISTDVKARADRGKSVVDETIAALAAIQDSVEQLSAVIQRLSDNSGRIDSIISVINNITRRTNLLALNASIIAAQAGEYGKSFGVVADEIRNLSLQTGQSTGEITEIINEILTESLHASENVKGTKDIVEKGVDLGRMMVDAFSVIQNSSAQSMNMTHEIKTATQEQANAVTYITRNIEDVSSMTSQIFNSSKEQNNAVKNIVRAIESIKQLAQEMAAVTGRQADGDLAIRNSLESVSRMVSEIFESMDERRRQSVEVVHELEVIRETSV